MTIETPSMTPGIYKATPVLDWEQESLVDVQSVAGGGAGGAAGSIVTSTGTTTTNQAPPVDTDMHSLDSFHATYTSEDNASFREILTRQRALTREKYTWLYDPERKQLALQSSSDDHPTGHGNERRLIENGGVGVASTSSSSGSSASHHHHQRQRGQERVNEWGFQPKNALIWYPEGVGSKHEPTGGLRGAPKAIAHANTRLPKDMVRGATWRGGGRWMRHWGGGGDDQFVLVISHL